MEPTIRKLYDSRLRLAILDALKDGPMRLSDLRREVNANAPNTSAKAKELEDMGLVERMGGDYQLTPYGQTARKKIQDSFDFYTTYEKFKEFWETHDTTGIPESLWLRIGALKNAQFVKNTETNIIAVHEAFLKFLESIKEIFYGVTPIFHKQWVEISDHLIKSGVDQKIIATKIVLEKTCRTATKDYIKLVDESQNSEVYLIDYEPKVAFTVSRSGLSLSLTEKNPHITYMDSDLYSTDPRAIQWGMDLFEYYKKQAKPVKLSDYL